MMKLFACALGLCIGSFLNVCIYRIPNGKSLVLPPSTCPGCGRLLKPLELIPVFSFLWLRGKCRGCGRRIALRYPLVELLTGVLFTLIFLKYSLSLETLKMMVMASLLIAITFIDIDHKIIPNVIVLPGVLMGFAFNYSNWYNSLAGIFVGFSIIALIIIASRGGMGWGDAKLLAMIGAFLGWKAPLYALFLGSVLGSVVGVTMILTKKMDRKTPMPFGPYLGFGALGWIFIPWWF